MILKWLNDSKICDKICNFLQTIVNGVLTAVDNCEKEVAHQWGCKLIKCMNENCTHACHNYQKTYNCGCSTGDGVIYPSSPYVHYNRGAANIPIPCFLCNGTGKRTQTFRCGHCETHCPYKGNH